MTLLIEKLPGWQVLGTEDTATRVLVRVLAPESEHACPRCAADHDALIRHGSRDQQFVEAPLAGRRASLVVKRRRHRCAACDAIVAQPLPLALEEHRITVRCRDQIVEQATTIPLLQVAEQVGVHRMVVQRLVGTGRKPAGRARNADTAHLDECQFCRRRFEEVGLEHHHPAPMNAAAISLPTMRLCRECHRLGCATWTMEKTGE
ncbi:transposase family protein [Sphingomonas sp. RHCKR7]|uniref:transposase family protein n=1 Tax=Sphingomonas folli TaxID=2862497 RepID=UPI001CA49DFB|nr:transposase family protein [Sphingomonas folli]MBW6528536.1 transposase family protein [Sphingomonas folli]